MPIHVLTHHVLCADPKYRGFRGLDYLTPQGLADHPRPPGVV